MVLKASVDYRSCPNRRDDEEEEENTSEVKSTGLVCVCTVDRSGSSRVSRPPAFGEN